MPIYEYKCEHCNQKYEALVKNINLTDDIGCPVCKSTKKKKIIFSIYGNGFKRNVDFAKFMRRRKL